MKGFTAEHTPVKSTYHSLQRKVPNMSKET